MNMVNPSNASFAGFEEIVEPTHGFPGKVALLSWALGSFCFYQSADSISLSGWVDIPALGAGGQNNSRSAIYATH